MRKVRFLSLALGDPVPISEEMAGVGGPEQARGLVKVLIKVADIHIEYEGQF